MIIQFDDKIPKLHSSVYIEDSAKIIGDVVIGKESSVWFNAVIRGDIHSIKIGERTNVQDLTMIHVTRKYSPTTIGNEVTIGHSVTLHGCTIADLCLIGMGSVILDDAEIAPQCLVAAGSLVPPRFKSKPGMLIMGSPAKIVRPLKEHELAKLKQSSQNYVQDAIDYRTKMKIIG